MILFPPCKINLGLYIAGKRPDGYHDLSSVMVQLPYCDILELKESSHFAFLSAGLPIAGNEDQNLCVKAWKLLHEQYQIPPVTIYLYKRIPMGAGLGGGSADGTYTLIGLNQLFKLGLSDDTLRELALALGSDCPLFVDTRAQLAEGRGEILTPIEVSLKGYYVQLLNLGIHVSTGEAFGMVEHSKAIPDLKAIMQLPIENWKDQLQNSFEAPVFEKHPILSELRDERYRKGAKYAAMTGSGSTIFALFDKKPPALDNFSQDFIVNTITLL